MKKTIILYGVILAVLTILLKIIEYKFLVREITVEIYITIIAIAFTALGIWVGLKTFNYKGSSENEFVRNTKIIETLTISKRELQVLEQLAHGLTNQQVADQLFISINTVKTHVKNLYEKLEVTGRTKAILKAKSLKIIA